MVERMHDSLVGRGGGDGHETGMSEMQLEPWGRRLPFRADNAAENQQIPLGLGHMGGTCPDCGEMPLVTAASSTAGHCKSATG